MSELVFLGLRTLAAIFLYAFVGWSFYLMWQALKSQTDFLSARKITPIKLGLLSESGEHLIHEFGQPEFFIGREPDCELRINDSAVSARHARLYFQHGHWWVEDKGSRNGTTINDSPLTMPTILANGDTITCGETAIEIILPE